MAQYSWDFQQDTPGQPPQGWRVIEERADNVSLSVAVSQGQTLLWETSNYTPPNQPAAATILEAENVTPTTTGEVEMVAIFRLLPGEPWGPEPEASMGIGLQLWKDIDAESGSFAAVDLEIHNIWAEAPGIILAGWWINDYVDWDDAYADFEGLEPGTWYVLRHTVTTSSVAATLSEFESGQQIVSLAVPLATLLELNFHVLSVRQLEYESAAIEFQWIGIGTDGDPAPMPGEETDELEGGGEAGAIADSEGTGHAPRIGAGAAGVVGDAQATGAAPRQGAGEAGASADAAGTGRSPRQGVGAAGAIADSQATGQAPRSGAGNAAALADVEAASEAPRVGAGEAAAIADSEVQGSALRQGEAIAGAIAGTEGEGAIVVPDEIVGGGEAGVVAGAEGEARAPRKGAAEAGAVAAIAADGVALRVGAGEAGAAADAIATGYIGDLTVWRERLEAEAAIITRIEATVSIRRTLEAEAAIITRIEATVSIRRTLEAQAAITRTLERTVRVA